MKMFLVLLSISLTFSEKIDRKYLPPPSSVFSGGSPGAVDIPLGLIANKYSNKGEDITRVPELVIGIDRGTLRPDTTFEEVSKNINNDFTQFNEETPVVSHLTNIGKSSSLNVPSFQTLEKIQGKPDQEAFIINYDQSITPEGYSYNYDTSNGIHGKEEAIATNGVKAKGSYSYIGDDGNFYQVEYTADENGFVPKGAHLPTAPPIPDAILRVIEIATKNKEAGVYDDGSYDDEKYGYKNYHSGYPKNQNHYSSATNSARDFNGILTGDFVNKNLSRDLDNRIQKSIENYVNDLSDTNFVNDGPSNEIISSRFSGIDHNKKLIENKTDTVTTPFPFLTPYVTRIDEDDLETSDSDEQQDEKQENHEDDDSDENENPDENLENDSIQTNDLGDSSIPDMKLMNAPQYGDRIRNSNKLAPLDEKDGYFYKNGNKPFIFPRIYNTTSKAVTTEFLTRGTLSNTAEKSQSSFVTPTLPNKSVFDIFTKSSNYPLPAQTVIPIVDANFTSIIPGLILSSKSVQTITPGRNFSTVNRPINANINYYPIVYNLQTSTEIIIGEEFNRPEQPQRFDPINGYHY